MIPAELYSPAVAPVQTRKGCGVERRAAMMPSGFPFLKPHCLNMNRVYVNGAEVVLGRRSWPFVERSGCHRAFPFRPGRLRSLRLSAASSPKPSPVPALVAPVEPPRSKPGLSTAPPAAAALLGFPGKSHLFLSREAMSLSFKRKVRSDCRSPPRAGGVPARFQGIGPKCPSPDACSR
jgi:hypothetical protein